MSTPQIDVKTQASSDFEAMRTCAACKAVKVLELTVMDGFSNATAAQWAAMHQHIYEVRRWHEAREHPGWYAYTRTPRNRNM